MTKYFYIVFCYGMSLEPLKFPPFIFSRDCQSRASVNDRKVGIEGEDEVSELNIYSGEVVLAALSNNRKLFAAVLGNDLECDLYLWAFQNESWSRGRLLMGRCEIPTSLEWTEVEGPHAYPPEELVLVTARGEKKTFLPELP